MCKGTEMLNFRNLFRQNSFQNQDVRGMRPSMLLRLRAITTTATVVRAITTTAIDFILMSVCASGIPEIVVATGKIVLG